MDTQLSLKIDAFFIKFKRQNYKKGELLIKIGDKPPGLFLLKEGMVRQYAISQSGEELTINIFKSTSFFPMAWIVNDSISSHYFEAMTDVIVWIAPKKDSLEFLKKEPDVLLDLVKRIYAGLDGYFMRMEHLMIGSAQARLVAELLIYARRFGKQKENSIEINFKLTERDLASQSGIARETVSREIQKLKQKGLISFQTNILVIKDLHKLEEELVVYRFFPQRVST